MEYNPTIADIAAMKARYPAMRMGMVDRCQTQRAQNNVHDYSFAKIELSETEAVVLRQGADSKWSVERWHNFERVDNYSVSFGYKQARELAEVEAVFHSLKIIEIDYVWQI